MSKLEQKTFHWAGAGRRLAAAFVAVGAMAIGAQSAHAGVAFTVGYDYVETEVSPHPGTHRTHMTSTYHVSGDKGVSFSSSVGVKAQGALGHMITVTNQMGEAMRVSYRVAGGAFVISGSTAGLRSVIRIVTDGHSSCTATRQFSRMPGHKYFDVVRSSNREPMVDSDVHAENVTCSVSETPD